MFALILRYINFGILLIFGVFVAATFLGVELNKKIYFLFLFSAYYLLSFKSSFTIYSDTNIQLKSIHSSFIYHLLYF